ncbi:MAG TPA: DsrE family protein [Sulfuricaulis sp.]|nr:DsrE family protein [Sulfuricaulis sp.]
MRVISRLMIAIAAGWLAAPGWAYDTEAAKPVTDPIAKVVWHVDFGDPRRLSAMIQNVNNMVITYQGQLEDYDVRIVFLAAGIRFVTEDPLKGTPFAEDAELKQRRADLIVRLQQLRELHGVKLELCEITREALNLAKGKIVSGVGPVRSGVVRIAELQKHGYAYLKVE